MLHLSPPSCCCCCCCSSGMFAGLLGGAQHALRVQKHHAPAWIFYFLLIKYEFMNLEEPPSFSLILIFLCKIIKKLKYIYSASPSPDFYSFGRTRMVILRSHRCPLTSDLLAIGPLVILCCGDLTRPDTSLRMRASAKWFEI